MTKQKSAGAVIFRREGSKIYYLLLHYASGHWDFPKGHIEKGESGRDAALREIKEETRIEDLKFIEGFEEKISYFFKRKHRATDNRQQATDKKSPVASRQSKAPLIYKEVLFYLAETKTKEVKISFEHIGFEWLTAKESLERATFKNAKEILEKAIRRIETNNLKLET